MIVAVSHAVSFIMKDDAGGLGGGLLQVEYEKEHELLRKIGPSSLFPIFAPGGVMSTKICRKGLKREGPEPPGCLGKVHSSGECSIESQGMLVMPWPVGAPFLCPKASSRRRPLRVISDP